MAVVIPIRFASTDAYCRDRIVGVLREHGLIVLRSDAGELGELYLLRANTGLGDRGAITDLLEQHVPGWQSAVEFYWPD